MDNNELLRNIRKVLALNENGMAEIFRINCPDMNASQVRNFLRQSNETDFCACADSNINQFLDALIEHNRGSNQNPTTYLNSAPSNNTILKKLRIAFNLKDPDMVQIFEASATEVSKQELKSLFRNPDHKNFKACDDALLRNFLKGLAKHSRPSKPN